ncbi:hypothetical protein HerbRD11066_57830 [Herbidospora sp. RD11066]
MRALIAVIVVMAGVLLPAGPASAGLWQFTDGFEGDNPNLRWSFTDQGECGVPLYGNIGGQPRTGTRSAVVYSGPSAGWCAIGRTIRLSPVAAHPGSRCGMGVWARVSNNPATQLNVEVIDPATWTYLALATVTSDGTSGYRQVTVTWNAWQADVVLRFATVHVGGAGPGVMARTELDDVLVQCFY